MAKKKITRKSNTPLNLFGDGGDIGDIGKNNNLSDTIGGIGTAAASIGSSIMQNSQIADTSKIENEINALNNIRYNNSDASSLMSSWSNTPTLNSVNYSDIRGINGGQQAMNILGATGAGASAGAKIGGIPGAIIGGAAGLIGSGVSSIVGSHRAKEKEAELNNKIQMANLGAQRTFANSATELSKNTANSLLANYSALGGPLHSNGADWNNGVTVFNNGGTHEQNPMNGIPLGVDQEGTPNLVEEGEVRFNDYMFSNRLFATKKLLSEYNLPTSYANHSFADIAEKLSKESEERPNDPISKKGLTDSMMKLQQAQEQVRAEEQQKEQMKQAALMQQIQQLMPNGNMPVENTPMEEMQQEMPVEEEMPMNNMFAIGGTLYDPTLLPNTKFNNPINTQSNNGIYSKEHFNAVDPRLNFNNKGLNYMSDWNAEKPVQKQLYSYFPKRSLSNPLQDNVNSTDERIGNANKLANLANLRYVPALGAGIGVMSDLLGWTNKPDYTDADKIGKIANNINPISARPIGNYMTYNPFDRNYYVNQLNAQSAATRNAIINQAGGNSAAAMANMLAADYNATNALGSLARQSEEYNQAQREKVETFNRGTDQFNAEMAMKADLANVQNNELILKALTTQAQLRDQIDMRSAAAKAANLTNLFDSLGDIGREEYVRNMLLSNPASYYGLDRLGNVFYKDMLENLEDDEETTNKNSKKKKAKRIGG